MRISDAEGVMVFLSRRISIGQLFTLGEIFFTASIDFLRDFTFPV